MSHSIHWDLFLPETADPASLLVELHAYLKVQNFDYVGDVIHRVGQAADYKTLPYTNSDRYSMIIARRLVFINPEPSQSSPHLAQDVLPIEVHALLTGPSNASEPAVFAFATYPQTVLHPLTGVNLETGCGQGWWGHGFCMTRGGEPAHSRVLKALDFLAEHSALAAINDESHRGVRILDPVHAAIISD